VTPDHPIFTRWPVQYPDRLQLFSLPTPNGVKVGIMLEETGLAYESHRVDIMANENHDPAFLALNPNGKIPAIYDPDGPSGTPLALFESGAILLYLADKTGAPLLEKRFDYWALAPAAATLCYPFLLVQRGLEVTAG
jgi:GST-like protein